MSRTPVSLIVEGQLEEPVLRQLIDQTAPHLFPDVCYGKHGRDWLRINLQKYNKAAHIKPFVVLADLERDNCPPELLHVWMPHGIHQNIEIRIVVHMLESWLLADCQACAAFLGVAEVLLPRLPDDEANPKQIIVNLARRSRLRKIREDLVPVTDTPNNVGGNYRGQLEHFVLQHWNARRAAQNSPSLQRAINSLQTFNPVIP